MTTTTTYLNEPLTPMNVVKHGRGLLTVAPDLEADALKIANSAFYSALVDGRTVFIGAYSVKVDDTLPAGHWFVTAQADSGDDEAGE